MRPMRILLPAAWYWPRFQAVTYAVQRLAVQVRCRSMAVLAQPDMTGLA